MYNFLKKAFHLSSEKNEDVKIEDDYLKSIILQAEKNNASEKTLKTIRDIISAISKKDKKTLREICSASGIPEEAPLLRSILWKINLKFLDLNVENWADIIAKKRSEYNNMKEAFIMKMEIDRKMHEDSSGNNTNNIIRKNGDSINETGEESKDSSSKSKSNSRNNLNCNNNSKSKLSSNNNNRDNLDGLNCNSNHINNSKLGFTDNFTNLPAEENENKNNLDKNANSNLSNKANSNNLTSAFSRNPTFGVITSNYTADGNTNKNGVSTYQNNNGKEDDNYGNKKILLENFIAKNQTDFSRNFLNLEFDERKLMKNKKNAVSGHNEIYKEFSRLEGNLLSNQVEIIKTFDYERNGVSHNKSFLHNELSAANITFDNQANTEDRNIDKGNKANLSVKRDKGFDFLKKLNEEKLGNTRSNKNLCKIPLPNYKTNDNVKNLNNKAANNEFNIKSSNKDYLALTPQIKLNRNEREASNENKNRNKIDFNFSVIDFLNKNVPNNTGNIPSNKINDNSNNNKGLNRLTTEYDNKDKINSLNFLTINNSNNPNSNCNNNPSDNANRDNTGSSKTCKIKPINLDTDLNKSNSNNKLTNNIFADDGNNKIKSRFSPNCITNNNKNDKNIINIKNNRNDYTNNNKNNNDHDLKNYSEEKKESKNPTANLCKKPKGANDKNTADPLLESLRKNAKMANYEDKALIEEIYKDMKRTYSEFGFLLKPTKPKSEDLFSNFHLEKILTQKNKNGSSNNNVEDGFQPETHLDVIARLLYIFAKLNKNIRYVQGMNELASLIYFVIMQEEELEKLTSLMQQSNKGECGKKNNNFNNNQNNENLQMQNNKVNFSAKKDSGLANASRNNLKFNKDKDKLIFKSSNPDKADEKAKNLDASNSINATTKLCDLARLEEAEEEKNFFDLNADRKIANFQVDSPPKGKFHQHQQENLVDLLQSKTQAQNYLLGHDKKSNHNPIKHKENPPINEFNNLHYMESVNNHEELFGLSSNRLVRNVNQSNNKHNFGFNHNDNLNIRANNNNDNFNNINDVNFGFDKQAKNKNEKQMAFGYLDKLNNKNNLFLTPDISKDRMISKLNLNQINSNNADKNCNNNNKINNLNLKEININAQSNYNHSNTNTQQNTQSAFTARKPQSTFTADKNANGSLNPKLHSHSNSNPNASKQNSPETDFEADTFWCFCYLMDQLKYIYLRSEDHKERGIMRKLDNLKNLLKIADKNLFLHLESVSVDISLFGFKWFVLLFSQNFCIKDALKIWDLILFVEHPTDIFYKVYYIALAVFEYKRSKIICMDFPGVVLQLQNLNDINVDGLIAVYKKIMKDSGKKIKKALGY